MAIRKIVDNVFYIGVQDWDRRIFDELIPLPDGTSYNSYLIKGKDKTAIIDSVDPSKEKLFINNLKQLQIEKVDYIISNHAEQDHSGAIPTLLKMYPEAKVVTNVKCKQFLIELLHIPEEKFIIIKEGDKLELGEKTLTFILTPWVHWPETMSTYLIEDKILFSCDFFGSHRATSNLFVKDEYKVIQDAKRYYAEIMMPFRMQIKKNIEKLKELKINYIAPSHGPVYDKPEIIINAYRDWISDRVEKKVLIPYVSMHDSTKEMVEYLIDKLINEDIEVIPFNLTQTDIGEYTMELVDACTVIFAAPYVLAGLHPALVYSAYLTNALRPKTKFVGFIGSYGWGGKGIDQLISLLPLVKAKFLQPVLIKGKIRKEEIKKLDSIVEKIKESILLNKR